MIQKGRGWCFVVRLKLHSIAYSMLLFHTHHSKTSRLQFNKQHLLR